MNTPHPYRPGRRTLLRRALVAALGAAAVAAGPAGCGRRPVVAPPEIRYGQTDCAECGMGVSDERYAAALVVAGDDGDPSPRAFDDIGCMVEFERRHPEARVLARYVKDFDTRQWLPAERAAYLHGNDIHSPMEYGLRAAGSRSRADALHGQNGYAVLDYPGLRDATHPATAAAPAK